MKTKHSLFVMFMTFAAFATSAYAQTFIRATLPNPSRQSATGYRFQILTPGDVNDAVARIDTNKQIIGDPTLRPVSYTSKPISAVRAVHEGRSVISFPFPSPLASHDRIDLRVSFRPQEYWKVYFDDVFQYGDGHVEHSRIPYAAFFISYSPTNVPGKLRASLTIVNNISSTYGIPKSVVNDDARRPITFHNARVYVNNSLEHYDLNHFDQADGTLVNLPSSFTLKAGESEVFDLGLVNAKSYVLTLADISYEGETEIYPIACSHPSDPKLATSASNAYPKEAPAR